LKLDIDENSKRTKIDPGDFTSIISSSPIVPKLKRKYESIQEETDEQTLSSQSNDINENNNEHNTPLPDKHYLMKRIQPQKWYSPPKTLLRRGRGKKDEERITQGSEIVGQSGGTIVNPNFPPINWIVI
jgi:hypothetical protein